MKKKTLALVLAFTMTAALFTGCGSNANNAKSAVAAQTQMPKDPLEKAKWLQQDVKKNMEAIDKAGDSLAEYYQKDPVKYKLLEPDKYYSKDSAQTMTQGQAEIKEVSTEQMKNGYEAALEVYNKNKKYYDNLARDKEELEKIHLSKDAVLDDGNKKH